MAERRAGSMRSQGRPFRPPPEAVRFQRILEFASSPRTIAFMQLMTTGRRVRRAFQMRPGLDGVTLL